MTRQERHEHRLLTADPDTLSNADWRERHTLLAQRRSVMVKDELKLTAPRDMRRRHCKKVTLGSEVPA